MNNIQHVIWCSSGIATKKAIRNFATDVLFNEVYNIVYVNTGEHTYSTVWDAIEFASEEVIQNE